MARASYPRRFLPWLITAGFVANVSAGTGEEAFDPGAIIAGCWQNEDGTDIEAWTRGSDGQWRGMAAVSGEDGIAFFEILHLHRDGDHWVYTAHPAGGPGTKFRSVALTADTMTFDNPDHDYPQRIRYQRANDTLTATISRADDSEPRSFPRFRCGTKG